MKKYTIEVDEEVYQFLKSKADVFVDRDANSVLRRLLLGKQINNSISVEAAIGLPDLPKAIPDTLVQLFEVVYLVKKGEDRVNAVKIVAERHHIKIPTVADKYIRGLGKNTNQFDRMLEESGYNELEQLLKEKFPGHKNDVEEFFKNQIRAK
ncbi:MAG: hypothetical protein NTX81_00195 [Candidatus Bathyarchaeota archaeon]|nr:hypothetical protein [Candidatus Bathyarchaeota archaeon]